jgi:hypothetical protein
MAIAAIGVLAPGAALAKTSTLKLSSGKLTIAFTPSVYATLTKTSNVGTVFSTHNTVALVAPATSPKRASYAFPVSSSKLNSKTLAGKIGSKGGLNLMSVSTNPLGSESSQFELTNFALHLGSNPTLTTTFVGSSRNPGQPLATLVTKHDKHSKHGHSFKLSNVTLKLTTAGVEIMQGISGTWKVGQTIGTASVSAT